MFLSWKPACPVSANQWEKTTLGFGLPTKTSQWCMRNRICNCSLRSSLRCCNLLITYEFPVFATFALRVLPLALPSQLIQPVKRKLETAFLLLPAPLPPCSPVLRGTQPAVSSVKHLMIRFQHFSSVSSHLWDGKVLEGSYLDIPPLPRTVQMSVTCAVIYGSLESWKCITARGNLP